ncbi:MAG: thymidine kinase [Chloroflexi bacterium]|nr:thymidine kinase [Chloroflexota bacterium]
MVQHSTGSVECITGSMFSGKTDELIRRLRRATIARQKVQVFKPVIDNRYSVQKVTSHAGTEFEATPVASAAEILQQLAPDTTVVGIDEAQFFDWKIADLATELTARGLRVIVAGLDTDFRGEPFGPMPILMAQAERVDKIHAICMVCGEPACRTQRLIDGQPARYDDPVVVVGASELYEARCREHHSVPHYADGDLLLLCILRGGVMFLTDLMRQISVPHNIDFMAVTSYGAGVRRSTGEVRIAYDLRSTIEGRDVLLVEDIVDTGHTVASVLEMLQTRRPRSLRVCTLLDKASRREVVVPIHYRGFEIPDQFVFGYGLDIDEYYRELPFIGVVKPELLHPAG